jgi:4-azaleucine resistance transporter AzlC
VSGQLDGHPEEPTQADVRGVRRSSIGLGVAVGAYGLGFGALAVANGLTVVMAVVMSLLVFTGASQFAFIGVVGAGGSPFSGVATALALGARNTFYGLRMAPMLKARGRHRLLAAQITIDESTAMAISQPTQALARVGFWTTGTAVFVFWNVATVVGAVAAEQISDPRTIGLDAAVGAAFLALLWPQLTSRTNRLVAGASAVIALLLTPVLPPGIPVLLTAAVGIVVAWPEPRLPPRQGRRQDDPKSGGESHD